MGGSLGWLASERAAAVRWARTLMDRRDWVVLDTETTGLGSDAEVVEIAVVDHAGVVLLDELVRPVDPIPAAATAVHGIGDRDVAEARTYELVHGDLVELVRDRLVVIYNAAFDRRILAQSARRYGLPPPVRYQYDQDAMWMYARFVGEWSEAHGDYRWQKLPPAPGVSVHRALGDCLSTLALIRRMAEAG
jgi:DNA polymerase-3 subunit epsilon